MSMFPYTVAVRLSTVFQLGHLDLRLSFMPSMVKIIEVVAHREGTDDILCRHVENNDRLAVIHLTWLMREEIGPNHPTVEVDGNINDFYAYERQFGIDC